VPIYYKVFITLPVYWRIIDWCVVVKSYRYKYKNTHITLAH
jgi:hypothetical protein